MRSRSMNSPAPRFSFYLLRLLPGNVFSLMTVPYLRLLLVLVPFSVYASSMMLLPSHFASEPATIRYLCLRTRNYPVSMPPNPQLSGISFRPQTRAVLHTFSSVCSFCGFSPDTMMEDIATHSLDESFQYRPFLSITERRSTSAVDFPSKSPVVTSLSQSIMANQNTSSSSQPTNNAVNMSSPARANRESFLSKMLTPDEAAVEEEEEVAEDGCSLDDREDATPRISCSEDGSISSADEDETSVDDSLSGGGPMMEDPATQSLESFHSHPFLSVIKRRRSRTTSVDFPSKSHPVVTTTSQSIMANQNSTCCSSQPIKNTVNVSSPAKANRESILSRKQAESIRNTMTLEDESTRRGGDSRSRVLLALKKSRMQQQQQQQQQQRIQFAEEVKIYEITPLQKALVHDMFYSEDSLADMRYEAFMESCGLDPSDFEYV
jgi:hypothetical protein